MSNVMTNACEVVLESSYYCEMHNIFILRTASCALFQSNLPKACHHTIVQHNSLTLNSDFQTYLLTYMVQILRNIVYLVVHSRFFSYEYPITCIIFEKVGEEIADFLKGFLAIIRSQFFEFLDIEKKQLFNMVYGCTFDCNEFCTVYFA